MRCEVWLSSGAGYFVDLKEAKTFQEYLDQLGANRWILIDDECVAINTDQIAEVRRMDEKEEAL
jgi:hypothetical protein